jgi:hypothetical protein
MRAMSTTPITDGIHQALDHAVQAEMDVDEGWMCVPEIHVSQITWKILSDEFLQYEQKPVERPREEGVLGYFRGYPIKPLKYGQGWTIIYRETQTTDKKRMN